MEKKLTLAFAVFVTMMFVSSATAADELLDTLTRVIHSAVANQLTAAGLTAPTIAQLSEAIIRHYGPDPNVAIKNLYDRLQGSQKDFEADLIKLLKTIYTGADAARFQTQVAEKGGVKLTEGLRPLQISAVEGIPEQVIEDQGRAFTRGVTNPRTDEVAWNGQFDKYAAKMKEIFNVQWNEEDLAARALSVHIGLPITIILDPTKENEVKAKIEEAGTTILGFLDAALRRVRTAREERLKACEERLSQYRQEQAQLEEQIRSLAQEVERLKGQGGQLTMLWTLVVVFGSVIVVSAGIVWRRGRRQRP